MFFGPLKTGRNIAKPQMSEFVLKRMERQKYMIFSKNHKIGHFFDIDLIFLYSGVK